MRRTRQDDKVRDGYAITPNYETATLLGNDNGRCPLFFRFLLRQIIDLRVGIFGIGITGKLNLIPLINGLPAQVASFLLYT